ncbi:MAG: sodium:solute symporter family protein [Verrucomicrobia bacterium]|nr:sodium:solute symporter family protein [Verrucomicrobiota bacterium]
MIHATMILAQVAPATGPADRTSLMVVLFYMLVLFGIGFASSRLFRGSSSDFFSASQSIGPFMLLMSVFGTTMTAFAMVGSTGKAFSLGIGVYGLMASSSALVHAACFFLIGIRMWAIGKKYGYVTQIQYFRDRFESKALGYVLFPILVGLIIPYLLVGLLGAGSYMGGVTRNMFPETFSGGAGVPPGSVPPWVTGLVISVVVLFYVFYGGVRSAAWANTFQTIVFMAMGVVGFLVIADGLGGYAAASQKALEHAPEKLSREGLISMPHFISYMFVPLSVGMFPHLFQHWLTARSAKAFRLTVIAHPICIMIVWLPCILLGIWAAGMVGAGEMKVPNLPNGLPNSNAVLGIMVSKYMSNQILVGLFSAGVLAAIMSSLDSQFVCIGAMFTNDFVLPLVGKDKFSDKQKVWLGRGFIVFIVLITYVMSLLEPKSVFNLGVWCFSGFAALFPMAFAAIYWRGTTLHGVFASILATALTWGFYAYDALVLGDNARYGTFEDGEYLVAGVMPVAFIVLASAAALILVSLITKKPSQSTLEKFFPKGI